MTTAQVEFTETELLADVPVVEPLIAGGVRCHGGFDAEGRYVSPRTLFRRPAIAAWGEQNCARFSTELIDPPLEWWERSYPSVDQARFLIRAGVPEPLMATLTRIGTVEGYGANIRLLKPKDLQRHFVEDVGGTADRPSRRRPLRGARTRRGGLGGRGGPPGHVVRRARHRVRAAARGARHRGDAGPDGLRPRAARAPSAPAAARRHRARARDDGDADDPRPLHRDLRLSHLRLGRGVDVRHRAGGGRRRGRPLVSYIRADETPHVGYLRTALSEMRDRTWVGEGGTTTRARR